MALARALFLLALAVAVALPFGGFAPTVAMHMPAASAMPDMAMPGGCDGCPKDQSDGMSAAGCAFLCGGALNAILPDAPRLGIVTGVRAEQAPLRTLAGRRRAPDLYPPKRLS